MRCQKLLPGTEHDCHRQPRVPRLHVGEDLATDDPCDTVQGPDEFTTLVDLPSAAMTGWDDAINSVEMVPAARGLFYENANLTVVLQEYGPGRAFARINPSRRRSDH